mmetsp:Transcript_8574/g.7910  ORF Transcript_8574/g.7910 Transcript_8574/m.7910 type:complete len:114 (-) Transcript_8574:79-420(-)
MAYGQTGSGKTHTIFGSKSAIDYAGKPRNENHPDRSIHFQSGIVPRCVNHIFDYINQNPSKQFRVTVAFLEIYMEQITDLLLQSSNSSSSIGGGNHSAQGKSQSLSPIRQGSS